MAAICSSSDEAGRGLGKAEGGSNLETKVRKGTGSREGLWKARRQRFYALEGRWGAAFLSNFLVVSFLDILSVGKTPHGEVLLYHPHWGGFAEGRGEGAN